MLHHFTLVKTVLIPIGKQARQNSANLTSGQNHGGARIFVNNGFQMIADGEYADQRSARRISLGCYHVIAVSCDLILVRTG